MNKKIKFKSPFLCILILLIISGCSKKENSESDIIVFDYEANSELNKEAENIATLYRDIYDKAIETNTLGTLEVTQSMVNRLGESGYIAVDNENQIDMSNAEQVIEFCKSVDANQSAEMTIISVTSLGGYTKYDFKTTEGNVSIVRGYYQYENGVLKECSTVSYPADLWQYTEEGYLLFEGSSFSDEYYILTLNEMPERTALRVEPLDKKCRELNRKYILPFGYKLNNMFLIDWSEEDYKELDFYDIFDSVYPIMYNQPIPYVMNSDIEAGSTYRIPKEEFESVVMSFLDIDSRTLQSKTTYFEEDRAYGYRPRGFYDAEYPDIPYPEVINYSENTDGTITLTVNAVYQNDNTSKAFSHIVVVRPLNNDSFQYVSNQMIFPEDGYEAWWRSERLSEDEWKEFYENNYLISEEEKEELKNIVLTAADQVKEAYKDIELEEGPTYTSNIKSFTRDRCKEVVSLLGINGYVSVTDDTNMENYEDVEKFYTLYMDKQDAEVTIFNVNTNGLIGATTFIYREGKLQTYYVGIGWKEGGIPEIRDTLVSDIAAIKLTEKGYFIYTYENSIAHSSLHQYWRIKPLSDKCRELTKKYIYGLSYVNYNMLVTNWNSSNVEDILMQCMFEDIYRIDTGENFKAENGRISAEVFERVMATYFPVSVEQLRNYCGYDEKSNSYPYEMIFGRIHPPFGEVVDYTVNSDGTLTLFVDGVWPDYNSDCAFTNEVVVLPFSDGTFRYISNNIEKKELEVPVIADITVGKSEIEENGGIEKGYNLPINYDDRKEAETDCFEIMKLILDIYISADKGDVSNVALAEKTILQMQNKLKQYKYPVTTSLIYSNIENYESIDCFLVACMKGISGKAIIYKICIDGSIERNKYIFDGTNMYVLSTIASLNKENEPKITYNSYNRIKEWRYSDKGWLCYKLCVPEPPEVTEIIDGSCLVRIKPISEENRTISEKCVLGLGYQGNNLLCTDWDINNMDKLDYNGLYEYLYFMKYQKKFNPEDYADDITRNYEYGIPQNEFESLIMEYIPVTAEQIQKYAVFDRKKSCYPWMQLGCFNYAPTYFGTAVPEVTDIKDNKDGTLTLIVDAVCEMFLCDDAVITHELTVQFKEDGSFQYLSNKILNDGTKDIPDYQYRLINKVN